MKIRFLAERSSAARPSTLAAPSASTLAVPLAERFSTDRPSTLAEPSTPALAMRLAAPSASTLAVPLAMTLLLAVAVLIAWGLKQHYADARADDLRWILNPTARLTGAITGATFVMQPGEGYFSRERLFLIEKSCAGVNFMIAAFAMLIVALAHRVRSAVSAAQVLSVGLLASYLAAVVVNTMRIAVAMWLGAHPSVLSGFSAADAHRIEGITVYFAGLVLLYELVQRLDRRVARPQEVIS